MLVTWFKEHDFQLLKTKLRVETHKQAGSEGDCNKGWVLKTVLCFKFCEFIQLLWKCVSVHAIPKQLF